MVVEIFLLLDIALRIKLSYNHVKLLVILISNKEIFNLQTK